MELRMVKPVIYLLGSYFTLYSQPGIAVTPLDFELTLSLNGGVVRSHHTSFQDANSTMRAASLNAPYLEEVSAQRGSGVETYNYTIPNRAPGSKFVYQHTGGIGIPIMDSLEAVITSINSVYTDAYGGAVVQCDLTFTPYSHQPEEGIYRYEFIMIAVPSNVPISYYSSDCASPMITGIGKSYQYSCPEGYLLTTGPTCANVDGLTYASITVRGPAQDELGCDCDSNIPSSCAGNPINVATGNKHIIETDYVGTGPSPLVFKRYYNSFNAHSTSHGRHWQHYYERELFQDLANIIHVKRPHGQVITFSEIYVDTWRSVSGDKTLLSNLAPGEYSDKKYIDSRGEEEYTYIGGHPEYSGGSAWRLQSLTDNQGNNRTLFYDLNSRLIRVENEFGQALTFSYHANGNLQTMTAPGGLVWTYRYNSNGYLAHVDNPDGSTRQYLYEDSRFPHALTGIVDENGNRYATYAYDVDGRAISSEHAGGVDRITLSYNTDGTSSVTNSRNISSTYSFSDQFDTSLVAGISGPGCSSCGTGDSSYIYDPANRILLSKTIKGLTTGFGNYDSKGNPGYEIEAVGTPEQRRTDYTYDPRFFNKIHTKTESSVFASGNKVTTYDYDDFGNIIRILINGYAPDGTPVARETTM